MNKKIKILTKPLSLNEIKKLRKKNGSITANVAIDHNDLIKNDLEWFLDEVSEKITDNVGGLTDIDYFPVGVNKNEGIIFSVTGNVDDFLWDESKGKDEL